MIFQAIKRTNTTFVRSFSAAAARRNLVSDLYVSELKSFKPVQVSQQEAEAATKAWKVPVTPKVPEIEGDITTDIAAYEASEVETESATVESAASETTGDDWFVVEEVKPVHH